MKCFVLPTAFIILTMHTYAQVWTNNGAVVNILPGTVVTGGAFENSSGSLTNSGTLSLSNDFSNLVTVSGSGNYVVGGNWNNTGTFTPGSGNFTFNGTGTQNISPSTFNNLIIDKASGTASPSGNLLIFGDLTINSGTLNISTYASNRSSAGGSMFMGNGASLLVSGDNNFPGDFSNHFLDNNSTVEYNGIISQSVAGIEYGNLILSNGGANPKTLIAPASVNGNITIAGATTFIDTSTLKIGGAISNSGIFTASDGTVELNGSSPQIIPAGTFSDNLLKNLTINNSAGVALSDTLKLSGILTPTQGQFATNDYLTLLSTPNQTALISGNGNGEVLDNVTMQRYLDFGFGYKYFSSPFEAATVSEFADEVNLLDSFPTFYSYDEDQNVSGWTDYTDGSGLLIPMRGYAVNFGSSLSSKTVDVAGVVNNGSIDATLYNHDQPFTKGFNLTGNPYPSPIDWNLSGGWTRTNVDQAIYYFNADTIDQYVGTYSSYVNGISSDSVAGNIIPSMQGFFVHVSDGTYPVSAQLTLNNAARTNDLSPVFQRSGTPPLLRLIAEFSDHSAPSDPLVLYYEFGAIKTFDKQHDALKLMNTNSNVPNIYALSSDSQKISIRSLDFLSDSITIQPLGLTTHKNGNVTIKIKDVEEIPSGIYIYLFDSQTGIYHNMRAKPEYSLYFEAGMVENRFFIVFSMKELISNPTNGEAFDVYLSEETLFLNSYINTGDNSMLVITSILGSEISSQQFRGSGSYDAKSFLTSGMYIVSIVSNDKVYSKKIIVAN